MIKLGPPFSQLAELIEKYLAAGEDQVIQRALERAPDFRVDDEQAGIEDIQLGEQAPYRMPYLH